MSDKFDIFKGYSYGWKWPIKHQMFASLPPVVYKELKGCGAIAAVHVPTCWWRKQRKKQLALGYWYYKKMCIETIIVYRYLDIFDNTG